MPAIEARALVKTYGHVTAVAGVDLAVRDGEIYGWLGPNGAGKTTTLKMILGLARPTSGEVRVNGVDVLAHPVESRASVGYLPETMNLYKTLTGRQTLRFFADLKGVARNEADERLVQVGLADAGDRRVGGYSKGMMQRLGLAQALLGGPRLLVLDEPTSGLDPAAARGVKDLLRELNRRGTTIFFSSHILSEVQELAHRVAILRQGRVVAEDAVGNLRSRLQLRGSVRIHLLAPPPAGLVESLRAVAGVEHVAANGLAVDVVVDPAARWKVIQAAEAAGAQIKDVETKDANLEDVFLRITGAGA